MTKIKMPDAAAKIVKKLQDAGYEAYIVGGCVRDSILHRNPGDWDITTSALPLQVKSLFRRTVDTGIAHGTVTVMFGKEGYEVTTYRLDGDYLDGRHPESVTFTASLAEDLRRRDFTINAMAYNDESGIVDLYDGMGDIERKRIRAVGDPYERFGEDALRIMRAVRFSAQLGYEIEDKTREAMEALAVNLSKISVERISIELNKLLCSDHPDVLRLAYQCGLTTQFLPEFDACMVTPQNNPHHRYNVGEHILHSLNEVPATPVLRLAMLFHDIGKPLCHTTDENGIDHFHGHAEISAKLCEKILRRLKYDNDTIRKTVTLVRYHGIEIPETPAGMRHAIVEVGEDVFPMLFYVKRADGAAQSEYRLAEKEQMLSIWRKLYDEVIQNGDCIRLNQLAVKGADLMACGMKPGKEFGEVLHRMFDAVLDHPEYNEKEYLLRHYLHQN